MDKKTLNRVNDLEKRILRLEIRRGGKLGDIAFFIRQIVNPWIEVSRIKDKAHELGYSWQMVQRARRELCPEIEHVIAKIGGHVWRVKR